MNSDLGGSETETLLSDLLVNTADFEQNLTRKDNGSPELRVTLSSAHTDFDGLAGYGLVGEHADPQLTFTLHFAVDRDAARLDLGRREKTAGESLEAELAVSELSTRSRVTGAVTLGDLAEFNSFRHQRHVLPTFLAVTALTTLATALAAGLTGLETIFLADPNLDTDLAGGGVGFCETIVDIGSQGVERNGTLAGPLDAGDFSAVDTAAGLDLDTLNAHVHGDLHCTLHRTLESDTTLELLRDRLSDELSIGVCALDFLDLEVDFFLRHLLELGTHRLDIATLAAEDNTRASAEECDANAVGVTLDEDLGDAGLGELGLAEIADLLIFDEERAEVLLGSEPTAAPSVGNADTKTDRINLLTHYFASFLTSVRTTLQWHMRRAIG